MASQSPICCMGHSKEQHHGNYLRDVLKFLEEYRWVYDFKLTDFILNRQWQYIPHEWVHILTELNTEELNNLPYNHVKSSWPPTLQHFLHQSQAFSIDRAASTDITPVILSKQTCRGMTPKKQHEVSRLAALVAQACQQAGCQVVVDVGAGLGYLGQVLSQQFSLKVLGLECEESRTHGAEKRARKQEAGSSDIESVTFKLLDSEESLREFQKLLLYHLSKTNRSPETDKPCSQSSEAQCTRTSGCQSSEYANCDNEVISQDGKLLNNTASSQNLDMDKSSSCCGADQAVAPPAASDINTAKSSSGVTSPAADLSHGVCLVGLHCCGSLTPTMLKVTAQLPEIKALVCVSCCYHVMPVTDGHCADFPLSQTLRQVLGDPDQTSSRWTVSTYALRLAAQETRARWLSQKSADHEAHTRNVAYRAVLEAWAQEQGQQVLKERRRLVPQKHCSDFPGYIEAVLQRTSLSGDDVVRKRLMEIYEENQDTFKLIEPFTALQVCLQPVLESLIMRDRLHYLQDHGLQPQAIPVFDEMISPRNMAIVLVKSESV